MHTTTQMRIQACTCCKKHKSRCEILDPSEYPVQCHRCKVLEIQCSYARSSVKVQACAACRKQKTRCEILAHPTPIDPSEHPVQCHRCKVLEIECLYERSPAAAEHAAPVPLRVAIRNKTPTNFPYGVIAAKCLALTVHMSISERTVSMDPPKISTPRVRVTHSLELRRCLPPGQPYTPRGQSFDTHYTPLLHFQPIRNSRNPLVDIVCSAVAAEYLEGTDGMAVRLRLQTLAYKSITQLMLQPPPVESLEAVQCLLIYSLWGQPFGASVGQEAQGRAAWSLITAAVRMAINLGLDNAAVVVDDMRSRSWPEDVAGIAEVFERARLAFHATPVTNLSPLTYWVSCTEAT
ncbi:hypothetical protein C8R44DRAFT_848144 [Mycena epipterygia]|nr:hypothetical protein C8R44DRAFT_848144 [Mycena epipterygia]